MGHRGVEICSGWRKDRVVLLCVCVCVCVEEITNKVIFWLQYK